MWVLRHRVQAVTSVATVLFAVVRGTTGEV